MDIEVGNSNYKIVRDIGYLVNSELFDEFNDFFKKKIKKDEELILKNLREQPGDEEILKKLIQVKSICFGITEECNFRCEYCIFSGKYHKERDHNPSKLNKNTAFKTIEFFLKLISNPKRNIRNNKTFQIGFYGGEPLLEFGLIKEIISYTKNIERKILPYNNLKTDFRITTNGYLLTNKTIDYFVKNDIKIDISLDGPENEHDKFRVLKDGSKTFNKIFENVLYIKEKYPEYYEKNVNYQPTVHPMHSEKNIVDFFEEHPQLFDIKKINFATVHMKDLEPEIRAKWLKNSNKNEIYLDKAIESIEKKFFLKNLYQQKKLTGTCFPGGVRVFVDTNGLFHICEKMNSHFPIGNIENGFDFDAIRSVIASYNDEIIRHRCWECDFWFLCVICFTFATNGDKIEINCERTKNDLKDFLKKSIQKMEKENEKIENPNYSSVSDYMDRL